MVRVTVSSLEQSVVIATTRDLGYDTPNQDGLMGEVAGPQWEFSARTKAVVRGLAEGEVHRFGVNAEYLGQVIHALDLHDGEEVFRPL